MKRLSVITMGLLVIGFIVAGCSTTATRDAGWTRSLTAPTAWTTGTE